MANNQDPDKVRILSLRDTTVLLASVLALCASFYSVKIELAVLSEKVTGINKRIDKLEGVKHDDKQTNQKSKSDEKFTPVFTMWRPDQQLRKPQGYSLPTNPNYRDRLYW